MATALAVVGSAVIGARASSKAAKSARSGQKEALRATTAATGQARGDITRLFGEAEESRGEAFGNVLDFISGAPSQQIAPFQRGNVLAQEQVGRGLTQVQRAILGQDVDLSGFQAKTVGAPESFDFDLSRFRQPEEAPQFDLSGIGSRVGTGFGGARRFAGGGSGSSIRPRTSLR